MSQRRVRWQLRVEGRRAFLERSALAAAWVGLVACGSSSEDPPVEPTEPNEAPSDAVTVYGAITPNDQFYITSCCGSPSVDLAAWRLSLRSRGEEVASLSYDELRALPAREKEHTLECISAGPGNLAISNAIWTGLPLVDILETVGVVAPAGTVEIKFESADGYTTSLPVGDLERPVWLVWLMNGVELPIEHGFPVRLLVPGRYGMKNPKWITSIDFVDAPYIGYWESNGWSNEANYLTNSLVHEPPAYTEVPAGALVVSGTAFAGGDPVVAVEVSIDGGEWTPATIDYAPGPDVWTLWHLDVTLPVGSHTVEARCTTASGAQSGTDATTSQGSYAGFGGNGSARFDVV